MTKAVRRRRPKSLEVATLESTEQYHSRAVTRALDVLECFQDGVTALSLTQLASRMQTPESSLFRLLVTLEARGYLSRDRDGAYSLAPRVLHGRLWERSEQLKDAMQPEMLRLARRFNETTSLAYLFEDRICVLASIESEHDIRAINKVGRLLPPYASSMGKAVTAFQPREQMERVLGVYGIFPRTPLTLTDLEQIYAEFEKIRKAGYATDRGEATQGGLCIGAPIFTAPGRVEASISISVPLLRMSKEREKEITAELLRSTADLSTHLQKHLDH